MQTATHHQNVATDKRVSKPVGKAYRALHRAEAAMLDISGGEEGFTHGESLAFKAIRGAMDSLCSTTDWTPFEINYK